MGDCEKRLIKFDWAAKHMLRDKANFDILEVTPFPFRCGNIFPPGSRRAVLVIFIRREYKATGL
ncbi:MAG: hypothetical protein V1872_03065 [bacterium]